jgi:hypothetical protein
MKVLRKEEGPALTISRRGYPYTTVMPSGCSRKVKPTGATVRLSDWRRCVGNSSVGDDLLATTEDVGT